MPNANVVAKLLATLVKMQGIIEVSYNLPLQQIHLPMNLIHLVVEETTVKETTVKKTTMEEKTMEETTEDVTTTVEETTNT